MNRIYRLLKSGMLIFSTSDYLKLWVVEVRYANFFYFRLSETMGY